MKAIGLITEYNPFHNGHLHQLNQIKSKLNDDVAFVAVMSGDFCQRGHAAFLNKWTRTKQALASGVSLVLELPAIYATGSADYFASGAIQLLKSTGIVGQFACGCETPNAQLFKQILNAMIHEPDDLADRLKSGLKTGQSFSERYARALSDSLCHNHPELDHQEILNCLRGSNNILALSYLKANQQTQGRPLKPLLLNREGQAYLDTDTILSAHQGQIDTLHDTPASTHLSNKHIHMSASAIRATLLNDCENDLSALSSERWQSILPHLPETSAGIMLHAVLNKQYIKPHQYADHILNLLLTADVSNLCTYDGWTMDFAQHILTIVQKTNHLYASIQSTSGAMTYEQLTQRLSSKHTTVAHIQRAITAYMLGIRHHDRDLVNKHGIPYIRVLGFNQTGQYLLKKMRAQTSVPILTKTSDLLALSPCDRTIQIARTIDLKAPRLWSLLAGLPAIGDFEQTVLSIKYKSMRT